MYKRDGVVNKTFFPNSTRIQHKLHSFYCGCLIKEMVGYFSSETFFLLRKKLFLNLVIIKPTETSYYGNLVFKGKSIC